MADEPISLFNAILGAAVDDADLVPIVDVSASETKKIRADQLALAMQARLPVGDSVLDWVNVALPPYNAPTDGIADASAEIQAAIDSLTIGGTAFFPTGQYYIATGLNVPIQGTKLVGEGGPGITSLDYSTTQIFVGDGEWGLTFGTPSGSKFRGYGAVDLGITEKNSGGAAGLLRGYRINFSKFERVNIGDCMDGLPLLIDGTGDVAAYLTFTDVHVGQGAAAASAQMINTTGCRWIGGYMQGSSLSGRLGLKLGSGGDTFRSFGTVIQGYDTLVECGGMIGNEFYGLRGEGWVTAAVHVLTGAKQCKFFGEADNSIAGSIGSGIVIDSGAEDTEDYMAISNVSSGSAMHVDSGTRTRFGSRHGATASASTPGTVVAKQAVYDAAGSLLGYIPIYNAIT